MGANDSPITTRSIITDYFDWRLNNRTTATNNRLFFIVRRIASDCEAAYHEHQPTFNLNISPSTIIDNQILNNIKSFHREIARQLFTDGATWTRVLTFIAFSAVLAERIIQQLPNNLTRNLIKSSFIDWTTEFIETELQPWLGDQNDWSGFLKLHDKTPQRRNSIGRYAGILGTIGMLTLGAFYMRRT